MARKILSKTVFSAELPTHYPHTHSNRKALGLFDNITISYCYLHIK